MDCSMDAYYASLKTDGYPVQKDYQRYFLFIYNVFHTFKTYTANSLLHSAV